MCRWEHGVVDGGEDVEEDVDGDLEEGCGVWGTR
jgi:hypothetical protein